LIEQKVRDISADTGDSYDPAMHGSVDGLTNYAKWAAGFYWPCCYYPVDAQITGCKEVRHKAIRDKKEKR